MSVRAQRSCAFACGLLLAGAGGCGGDPTMTTGTEATTGTTTSEATTSSETTSTSTTAGTTDSGTTEFPDPTGFDPPEPMCGNGYVEDGEQCDDGNAVDDDECTNECLVPCGIEWTALAPAPSLESLIGGWYVATDPATGDVVVAGRQREIIVDQEENVTEGDDQLIVIKYDSAGAEQWSRLVSAGQEDTIVAGLALDDAGDIGVIATIDGDDGEDIWAAKLAGADGADVWSYAHDAAFDGSDDLASGVAFAPGGDLVLSGEVVVTDGDIDIWVARLAGADGTEQWTSTYSGQFDNNFSVDHGGPVGVASDGAVYVAAEEYVNFETVEATLVRFAADGSGPEWSVQPLADGEAHQHFTGSLAVDPDDNVIFSASRPGLTFWLFKVNQDQSVAWTKRRTDFTDDTDLSWTLTGFGVADAGQVIIGGHRTNEAPGETTDWLEAWWARLGSDGAIECQHIYQEPSEGLFPGDLLILDTAATPAGGALLTGEQVVEGESAIWTSRFRP